MSDSGSVAPLSTTLSHATVSLPGIFSSVQKPTPIPSGPTRHQSDQVAAMLAHELGHLLLSHSLETWAGTGMYELLTTMTTDRE